MFFVTDKILFAMGSLRIISGIIEFSAALLMFKFNNVEDALKINAVLAVIGPLILMLVITLGLTGIAGKATWDKLLIISAGAALIFYGIHR